MKIWDWIARHGGGIQRREDWADLLGDLTREWDPFLERLSSPVGVRFWAQLGGGEEEYVVQRDSDGFWAVPVEGGAPRRLNPTQAEFDRLDLERLFTLLRSELAFDGSPQLLRGTSGAHALGHRDIEGRTAAVFCVPCASDLLEQRTVRHFLAPDLSVSVGLALVPRPAEISPDARRVLRQQRIVVGELPVRAPWAIDWSALATAGDLGFDFQDLGALCGRRFVLMVDKRQRKAWIEGHLIRLKADTQPYRLLEYLAERPGTAVPNYDLANPVLESDAESMEARIVDDVKRQLKERLREALDGVIDPRITADTFIKSDGGRQILNISANLVFVRS